MGSYYPFFMPILCLSIIFVPMLFWGPPLMKWLHHFLIGEFQDEQKAEAYVNRIMGEPEKPKGMPKRKRKNDE